MTSDNKKKRGTKPVKSWAKYTGLVFQGMAIIGLGVFGGIKLDQYLHTDPIFTVTLSLLSVIAGIYVMIKDFIKPDKNG